MAQIENENLAEFPYRVYVAGPMTGLPNYNFDTFAEVAAYIRGNGLPGRDPSRPLRVINPAENFDGDQSLPRRRYLALAVHQVALAHGIVLLPDWHKSEGVQLEATIGLNSGATFYVAHKAREDGAWSVGMTSHEIVENILHALSDGQDTEHVKHPANAGFVVKDSGERMEYASGMRRDVQDGKPNYGLLPREFLTRWAHHMAKAVPKYGRDNWRLANSQEELDRFEDSAFRHLVQWLDGDRSEDHAAAVAFNVAAAEYVRERLSRAKTFDVPLAEWEIELLESTP